MGIDAGTGLSTTEARPPSAPIIEYFQGLLSNPTLSIADIEDLGAKLDVLRPADLHDQPRELASSLYDLYTLLSTNNLFAKLAPSKVAASLRLSSYLRFLVLLANIQTTLIPSDQRDGVARQFSTLIAETLQLGGLQPKIFGSIAQLYFKLAEFAHIVTQEEQHLASVSRERALSEVENFETG